MNRDDGDESTCLHDDILLELYCLDRQNDSCNVRS